MLRIGEVVQLTDTGRQREANEDSYFSRAPAVRGRRRHGRGAGRRGRLADGGRGVRAGRRRGGRLPGGIAPPDGPGGQPRDLRPRPGGHVAFGHGDDADRRPRPRRGDQLRPRRRQPCLRLPRRQAQADHQRPLAGRGAAPPGQAHPRPGRRAPAALGDHPGAGPRAPGAGRHDDLQRPRRRRLPALLRRADDDADRRGRRDDRRRRRQPADGRPAADPRRQRSRRAGQHHGRPVPARERRRRRR